MPSIYTLSAAIISDTNSANTVYYVYYCLTNTYKHLYDWVRLLQRNTLSTQHKIRVVEEEWKIHHTSYKQLDAVLEKYAKV